MPGTDPVAVIGMGAVGMLLAGALAAAGHPILACGCAPLATITVTTGTGSTSYPVTWTDEPGDLRGVRWAVLATKIHDTAAAAGWLSALGPGLCLLAAQNGANPLTALTGRRAEVLRDPPVAALAMDLLSALPAAGPQGMP